MPIRYISADSKKAKLKNGIITIRALGYDVDIPIDLKIGINSEQMINMGNGIPVFYTGVQPGIPAVHKTENSLDIQQIKHHLKKESVIPISWDFDDFMIGFIYSNQQDPDNHKWMLQLRKQNNMIMSMPVMDVNIRTPVRTTSWSDQNGFHGRFVVAKSDFIKVQEEDNSITILGKTRDYQEGDKSLIPEGCNFISIRYSVFTNIWTAVFMRNDKELSKVDVKDMDLDISLNGRADRSFEKPKVTQVIDVNNVQNIYVRSDILHIEGK